jgi:hypothetical protein
MKIGGRIWILYALGAPLAHAQGSAGQKTEPPVPASSATFAPESPAPELASEPPAEVPASPEPAPAPEATAPPAEPRPARVIMAPSNAGMSAEPAASPLPGEEAEQQTPKHGPHVHDGFYLRCALGAGYVSATSEKDSIIKGWGVAPDIWIGGSPVPGLAIGVTFNGVSVPDPNAEISAADSGGLGPVAGTAHGILTYSVFGLVADYYPDPTGGLHFMAGLNYSVLKFAADTGAESTPATGVGLLGGLGYEWWIGREWSVGPLARLHWAALSDDAEATSVLSPVLMLGFTNH